jgi:hypothetical protein
MWDLFYGNTSPPPPGITFPAQLNIAEDMLNTVDGLTTATIKQMDPDYGTVLQTSTAVILKRNTGVVTTGVGDGELGEANCSHIRIWAQTMTPVNFIPKYRDQITDAEGITWMIPEDVQMQSFNGFYVFERCVQVKT